ncbi:Os09g0513300 [Oryza sativa Japonica Group]|uniref:Os09g0513300 protein n=1 Tax=Oryza sativa subsp. japonica TaxID=39947 RepID=C7J6K9_ORYSJ|nr:Os09g0513300 [Oryza sativa Japonica Group]|eukprot:NP_001175938.1 Os09g0513300 [Oryza sativa Japonica Group]
MTCLYLPRLWWILMRQVQANQNTGNICIVFKKAPYQLLMEKLIGQILACCVLLTMWLVTDIPEAIDARFGNEIVPYEAPRPPAGIHRLVFVLFKQEARQTVYAPGWRQNFNVRDFSAFYNLGPPVAALYFNCQKESGVGGRRFLLGVLRRGGDRGDQQERRAGVAVRAGARRLQRRGCGVRRWVHELFEFIVGNHGLTSHHGGELAVPRRERRVPGGETEPERGQHRGLPERDTSSEPDLARAVAAQPVSVTVDAGNFMF